MENAIHDAILAEGGWGDPHREAEVEEAIRLDQRTISIGDLIGLGIEKIEPVKLDRPAIVKVVACATVNDARHRRSKRVVFGQRRCAEVTPPKPAKPAGLFSQRDAG